MPARIVYFTAGTVGAGHSARGLAIERALRRAGSAATFATVGPRGAPLLAERPHHHPVTVDPTELAHPERARSSELARTLDALAPDVLLVDLFWAPLRHLLPRPGCEAWLLVRRAGPDWFRGPPGLPFEPGGFTRVLGIEPGLDATAIDETIPPVVTVTPDERKEAHALHDALGVPRGERLRVVHHAGEAGEWRTLIEVVGERPVHVIVPGPQERQVDVPAGVVLHDGRSLFPLAAWLPGATQLASGAGYNAFWEARTLSYFDRTAFVPFRRAIDDQAWRLRACRGEMPRGNGADVLARSLS